LTDGAGFAAAISEWTDLFKIECVPVVDLSAT